MTAFRTGDIVTIDVPTYRRWWQFWRKPIIGWERRDFVVECDGQTIFVFGPQP